MSTYQERRQVGLEGGWSSETPNMRVENHSQVINVQFLTIQKLHVEKLHVEELHAL
jgi:hypothetical protein